MKVNLYYHDENGGTEGAPYYNDVERTVEYLKYSYGEARQAFMNRFNSKPFRPSSSDAKHGYWRDKTDVMGFDEDFCYLINEIQRGAECMVPLYVTEANELIDKINEKVAS